jgi:hypothetical protein
VRAGDTLKGDGGTLRSHTFSEGERKSDGSGGGQAPSGR